MSFPIFIATLPLVVFIRLNRHPLPSPPGPAGEWLFGNARQIPTEKKWITFARWTERYTPFL
ncbi:hypothetical protein PILCRDRAFT_71451 [Piloderma croceum F 1598]|uniref:Cytochrome P450 n=1 Tax=Piloderma croceum (strain F 1598) TaxID=765440 RepID=A0A0C3BWQ9_PILCF|nr:hypothetical protein PILCRDRAFT_71451 [Piloderma croceum F 1598]